MEELARAGFWLAVGVVIAASIIAEALKERERERQKHETRREMMRLEAEGKLTPETLKYMRERDEAEQLAAERLAAEGRAGDRIGAFILAFFVGVISFIVGLLIFALILRIGGGSAPSAVSGIVALLTAWIGGLRLAFLSYRAILGRKKAPPSGA